MCLRVILRDIAQQIAEVTRIHFSDILDFDVHLHRIRLAKSDARTSVHLKGIVIGRHDFHWLLIHPWIFAFEVAITSVSAREVANSMLFRITAWLGCSAAIVSRDRTNTG